MKLISSKTILTASDLITYGSYEKEESDFVCKYLEPGMVFADVGAKIGCFSLKAARKVGAGGRVYAFEPDPHNFDLLSRSIRANHLSQVIPVPKLVSNQTTDCRFFLSAKNFGAHSMVESNVVMGCGGEVPVQSVTLDVFFEEAGSDRLDFIKMDIQGSEGLALEGAQRVLQKNGCLKIFMEFWPYGLKNAGTDPAELLKDLRLIGFQIKLFRKNKLEDFENVQELLECMKTYHQDYANPFLFK